VSAEKSPTSPRNIEIRRALEILRRRNALLRAGIIDRPPDYADDLYAADYVPLPD
jgi:hypothetical protein